MLRSRLYLLAAAALWSTAGAAVKLCTLSGDSGTRLMRPGGVGASRALDFPVLTGEE